MVKQRSLETGLEIVDETYDDILKRIDRELASQETSFERPSAYYD